LWIDDRLLGIDVVKISRFLFLLALAGLTACTPAPIQTSEVLETSEVFTPTPTLAPTSTSTVTPTPTETPVPLPSLIADYVKANPDATAASYELTTTEQYSMVSTAGQISNEQLSAEYADLN
jgi:hypothetical protein